VLQYTELIKTNVCQPSVSCFPIQSRLDNNIFHHQKLSTMIAVKNSHIVTVIFNSFWIPTTKLVISPSCKCSGKAEIRSWQSSLMKTNSSKTHAFYNSRQRTWYSVVSLKKFKNTRLVGWCLTSHLTHYRPFQGWFLQARWPNRVKAMKETSWSSRSDMNPTRTTPPCYNNTNLGNRLYTRHKGPNVTSPICLICKSSSHKCVADCKYCVT